MAVKTVTDPEASRRFRDALADGVGSRVLDPSGAFICPNGASCRASVGSNGFAAGQLSYVGDHYAVEQRGEDLRVLVVSMQVGDDEAPVSFARRREQVRVRIDEPFGKRNPHMMGVTTALRVLFGGSPGEDAEGEHLKTPSGPVHVLDAYSMANSVLCSNRPGPGRKGGPTSTMLRNCSSHLADTVRALRPTILHSQGRPTRQAIEAIAGRVRWLDEDEHVADAEIAGLPMVWCSLRHPTMSWAYLRSRDLGEFALPALQLARSAAGLS